MIAKVLKEAGRGVVRDLRTSFAEKDVNASGRLSRTLRSVVEESAGGVRMFVDAQGYVFEVEEGTPPANQQGSGNRPPGGFVAKIKEWMRHRNFSARGKEAEGLAWAIATTINRQGTRRHRGKIKTGAITDVINDARINEIIDMLADEIQRDALEAITKTTRE